MLCCCIQILQQAANAHDPAVPVQFHIPLNPRVDTAYSHGGFLFSVVALYVYVYTVVRVLSSRMLEGCRSTSTEATEPVQEYELVPGMAC